ncbi:GWxTD domain-containing protein, partial [candidate division KSB1 bacterium]|nr:GWxTD domain-containing protein [candidate division KSB1 bacterium]
MTHLNKALLFFLSIFLISSVTHSQVVIDVRSDTASVTISDSVIILKRQLIDHPSDMNLHLKLAEIYLQREMLDEAEQEVSQVLSVDTLSVHAITTMGRVYFQREPSKIIPFERIKEILKKDHKSKAIKKFKEALALDANYKPARYFLARTYLEKGNPDNLERAKDEFTRLFNENRDYQDICYQLGYTYQKMGKYDEALEYYKKTRHKKYDFARANVRMADLYYETGNPKLATESFFEGIEELEDRELLDYLFEEQKIIMTKEELGEFENVTHSAKKKLIKKFWKRRDPDPSTPENERLIEHFRRAKFARENFHFTAPPYYDDRGKIYIKYGQPDDRHSAPVGGLQAKDNESWSYESIEKGLVFDFVSDGGYFHEVED